MKSLFCVLILLTTSVCAQAQERQIGAGIQSKFYTASAGVNDPTVGGFLDATLPFGEYVSVNGRASYDRYKSGVFDQIQNNVFNYRGDARYTFFEQDTTLRPFVSGGIDGKTLFDIKDKSNPTGYYPRITYLSPTVGAGLNFKNHFTGHYFYAFQDFESNFREKGHHVRGDVFLPVTEKWNLRLGAEYSDLSNDFTRSFRYSLKNLEASFGFSRKF